MVPPRPARLVRLAVFLGTAFAAIAAAVRADECAQCTAKAMCAPHKEVDKGALETFKAAYKDKDPERRIAALKALAEVNRAHDNHRSRAAAQAMAAALRDPAAEVRREIPPLLGGTQEAATALKALGTALDAHLGKLDKLDLKKARGTPEYTQDLLWLRALYQGVQKTANREASPWFVRGLVMMNAEVVQDAAKTCGHLKTRAVIDAVLTALEHLAGTDATEATGNAWREVCKALPEMTGHTGVAPQKDSNDAARFVNDWKEWWKANRGKKQFE